MKLHIYFLPGLDFFENSLCYVYYDINNEILLFVENIINDSFLLNIIVQTNENVMESKIMTNKINEYKNDEYSSVIYDFNFKDSKLQDANKDHHYLIGFERYFVTYL